MQQPWAAPGADRMQPPPPPCRPGQGSGIPAPPAMCLDSGPSASAAPARLVALGQALLERNDRAAADLRQRFRRAGLPVVNLLSSPGAGKTALLERLGRQLAGRGQRLAVIVGDLATDHDARRLAAAGVAAVPISTGQTCHLETAMVARGLSQLQQPLADLDLLVIENVGNLVCPAAYDLGEGLRVVLLSVTEGEDKPLKYPTIFHSADLVVISKVDLAEAVGFERQRAREAIAAVAPRAAVLEVSARSGIGLEALAARLLAPLAPLAPLRP